MGDCFIEDLAHECGRRQPTELWRGCYLAGELWCNTNSKIHRDDGPAFRAWTPDDEQQLICEEWWIDGEFIERKNYAS